VQSRRSPRSKIIFVEVGWCWVRKERWDCFPSRLGAWLDEEMFREGEGAG
jgi:hypothetical protein